MKLSKMTRSHLGAISSIALAAVVLGGCSYSGVGSLAITEEASTGSTQSPGFTGTFDRYLSREDGDVYTFTAYQRVKSRQKFGQYYRNYRKDGQLVQAELVVRINKSGEVIGEPRLLFRQGNRILTDGLLNGELSVTPKGDRLSIAGENLVWKFEEKMSRVVSFELVVFNVLVEPPPKDV